MRAPNTVLPHVTILGMALTMAPLGSGAIAEPAPKAAPFETEAKLAAGDQRLAEWLDKRAPLIALDGKAHGGTLVAVDTWGDMGAHHTITTSAQESAREALARLMEAIQAADHSARPGASSPGEAVAHRGLALALAGSESGFGVTPVPRGLSGFVDWERRAVRWFWRNPAPYGAIGMGTMATPVVLVAGESNTDSYDIRNWRDVQEWGGTQYEPGQWRAKLWGYQDWRPSAPAHIEIDRCTFREPFDPPHVMGLHPNWQRIEFSGQSIPLLERATKPLQPGLSGVLPKPTGDSTLAEVQAYVAEQELLATHRVEMREDEALREAVNAGTRRSTGSKLDNPRADKSYQSLRIPSGVAAIYRPVLVTPADRHEVGLRLKFDVPGLSVERAPARVRLLAHVGAAYSVDEAVRKFVAAGAGADPAAFGLAELASLGPGSLPADWTDYTSAAKFGDEGILIPGGAEEMSLVVLAENLGDIELGIDWFWCRKLNCSDEIPQGWDPYRVE